MADANDAEKVFMHTVHQVLTEVPGVVFPAGHTWAGLTKAESLAAVRSGFENSADYSAAQAPPAVAQPKVPDTGPLPPVDGKKK